jgi:hypothetical protein
MQDRNSKFITSPLGDSAEAEGSSSGNRGGLVLSLVLPLSLAFFVFVGGMVGGLWSLGTASAIPDGVPDQIEAVREEIVKSHCAPSAVSWLDEALSPGVDSADALTYVRAALDEVVRARDPQLSQAESDLRQIIAEFQEEDCQPGPTLKAP